MLERGATKKVRGAQEGAWNCSDAPCCPRRFRRRRDALFGHNVEVVVLVVLIVVVEGGGSGVYILKNVVAGVMRGGGGEEAPRVNHFFILRNILNV